MLFALLFAAVVAMSVVVGSCVLLSLPGVLVVSHTLGIVVLIGIILIASFLWYKAAMSAYDELVYWF